MQDLRAAATRLSSKRSFERVADRTLSIESDVPVFRSAPRIVREFTTAYHAVCVKMHALAVTPEVWFTRSNDLQRGLAGLAAAYRAAIARETDPDRLGGWTRISCFAA
ncbi:hypothetical protein CTAM01_17120 [Colletotrichum tamarilloi]|uniref:Uncharacterized protein n=1 Tax=Colletotrichum tamarilloi TaxID=1209934 RepID=A0ABQ9QGJ9_9PEZI|nr:uncharacterized protein CTAM01_17120 [Colletotrichum tamarilloi]KAK1461726.1 hypothetical protein CTAM01_17120 [Colletotrichum tamarilloi]